MHYESLFNYGVICKVAVAGSCGWLTHTVTCQAGGCGWLTDSDWPGWWLWQEQYTWMSVGEAVNYSVMLSTMLKLYNSHN